MRVADGLGMTWQMCCYYSQNVKTAPYVKFVRDIVTRAFAHEGIGWSHWQVVYAGVLGSSADFVFYSYMSLNLTLGCCL